LRLRNRAE
jgi:hypothetical protein